MTFPRHSRRSPERRPAQRISGAAQPRPLHPPCTLREVAEFQRPGSTE